MIPGSNFTEPHHTVKEPGAMWRLSPAKVRRMFCNELGVRRFGVEKEGHKRAYVTLRIPASVAQRVYERCKFPGLKTNPRVGNKKEAA